MRLEILLYEAEPCRLAVCGAPMCRARRRRRRVRVFSAAVGIVGLPLTRRVNYADKAARCSENSA